MIAQIEHTSIGYDDVGQGPPVVFLHAFPLNRTMWSAQKSALSGHRRCITIDMRGFGDSAAEAPHGMDRYADDVAGILEATGTGRATIVGLSMGGYIVFALWRRHPELVRALVLADTRAGDDAPDTRERRHELIALARGAGVAAVADRQMIGLLGKTTRDRRPDVVSLVHSIALSGSVDGVVGALEAMLARPDSTSTLSTIDVPTLVIAGEEDVLTPPKEARAMHAAIAGSRLELLAHAGHLSCVERPAAFNAVLTEFLREVESA
ncbi:MAG TPA: alpha/beta fold hydrolase, partial [Gemmatimonadaceae bacterium]|nr:alpha/beta fold hydrolase [Gemmatimonadaceae bacterium]